MKKVLLFALAIASSACFGPLFPGVPSNTVTVTVLDQNGDPVAGVRVTFNDWSSSGAAFNVSGATNTEGRVLFAFYEIGERRCELQLPAGFRAGPAGLSQLVYIEKGKSVRVDFSIVRA